jgi:hypothetical protein
VGDFKVAIGDPRAVPPRYSPEALEELFFSSTIYIAFFAENFIIIQLKNELVHRQQLGCSKDQ